MPTTNRTKASVLEYVEAPEVEVTPKKIIDKGIAHVIEATGIDVQKNRYKAMRAIAYQAFIEAIDREDYDGLVDRAIANLDNLPSGWEIEAPAKVAPVKATPATKTAAR